MTQQDQSIEKSLETIIQFFTNQINTCIPAKIVKIRDSKHIDVQPTVKKTLLSDDNKISIDYPVIPFVPVCVLGTKKAKMRFKIRVGDPVLILFSQHSIDKYMLTDGVEISENDDIAQHDINNAMALIGFLSTISNLDEIGDNEFILEVNDGSSQIIITSDNKVQVKASTVELGDIGANKALALAEKCDSRLDALESFQNNHVHIDPLSASTGTALVPFIPGNLGASTASNKVFTTS